MIKAGDILSTDKAGFNLDSDFSSEKQEVAASVECLGIDAQAVLLVDPKKARLSDIVTSDDSEWHVFTEQDGKWTMQMIYSNYKRSRYEYVGASNGAHFLDAVTRAGKYIKDGKLETKKAPVLVDTHTLLFLVFEASGDTYVTYGDYMLDPAQFTKMWKETQALSKNNIAYYDGQII